jgi:hypothetical protein
LAAPAAAIWLRSWAGLGGTGRASFFESAASAATMALPHADYSAFMASLLRV